MAWKTCRKIILEALFFAFEKKFFIVSVQNFGHCRLHEIIGLQLSQCLSANHNPELHCVICTGVTLFAPVLHFLHWCYTLTALLWANQNRVIFSCVLLHMLFFTCLVFLCSSRLIILNKRLPTSDFRLPTRDFLLPTSELRSRTSDFGFRALGLGISTPAILIAVIKKVDEEESCKLSSIRFSPEIYSCLLCEYFGKGYPFWILCTSAHYYTWTQLYNWIHSIDKEIRKLNSKRRRENNKTFWSPKSDVESRKLEVGSRKSEVWCRKSEVPSQTK